MVTTPSIIYFGNVDTEDALLLYLRVGNVKNILRGTNFRIHLQYVTFIQRTCVYELGKVD